MLIFILALSPPLSPLRKAKSSHVGYRGRPRGAPTSSRMTRVAGWRCWGAAVTSCLSPGVHHQAPLTRLACAITIKVASREGAAAVFTRIAPWDLPLRTKLHVQNNRSWKSVAFMEDSVHFSHVWLFAIRWIAACQVSLSLKIYHHLCSWAFLENHKTNTIGIFNPNHHVKLLKNYIRSLKVMHKTQLYLRRHLLLSEIFTVYLLKLCFTWQRLSQVLTLLPGGDWINFSSLVLKSKCRCRNRRTHNPFFRFRTQQAFGLKTGSWEDLNESDEASQEVTSARRDAGTAITTPSAHWVQKPMWWRAGFRNRTEKSVELCAWLGEAEQSCGSWGSSLTCKTET